ncbi:unnamed protein product [Moneuplotes crassus]|uniref:Uncharacterized protein n=2 Tax=Euplotes crassus TaxID=5936 RepID=A0AAD1Y3W4_EUPCR|nr:unnamed protein product [Moneuplotes crassus]
MEFTEPTGISWLSWIVSFAQPSEDSKKCVAKSKISKLLSRIEVSHILPYFGYLNQCAVLMSSLCKATAKMWEEYFSLILKMEQKDFTGGCQAFAIQRLPAKLQAFRSTAGISRSITTGSQKALVKYYEVIVKAGCDVDIIKLISLLEDIRTNFGLKFNDDVVFSEINIFDKISDGGNRRKVLEIVKETYIKRLVIPNTTFSVEQEVIPLNRVRELRLFKNFIRPDIDFPCQTLKACPNIEILNLEQIQLSKESCDVLIEFINSPNSHLHTLILHPEESNALGIISKISSENLKIIKNCMDKVLTKTELNKSLNVLPFKLLEETKDLEEPEESEHFYSALQRIEFTYSEHYYTRMACFTLNRMQNLRYVHLLKADNKIMKKILFGLLKYLPQCEEIMLESKAYFFTEYPRISFGLTSAENQEKSIGVSLLFRNFGLDDMLYSIQCDHFQVAFDYSFLQMEDYKENQIEINGKEYACLVHLKGIKSIKDANFQEKLLSAEDYENLSFVVSPPEKLISCEIISLSITDRFINYLHERSLAEESLANYGNSPQLKIGIYLSCHELPLSNLEFYIKLLKSHKIQDLCYSMRLIPSEKFWYDTCDPQEGVQFLWNGETLEQLLELEIRVKTFRIYQCLVDFTSRLTVMKLYALILNQVEHASFMNEIYFNCGYLSCKDIIRFLEVIPNKTPYAERFISKIFFTATMDQTPTKRREINQILLSLINSGFGSGEFFSSIVDLKVEINELSYPLAIDDVKMPV